MFNIDHIEADPAFVDDEGVPRTDALIFEDRIVCHPDYAQKVKEGLENAFSLQPIPVYVIGRR